MKHMKHSHSLARAAMTLLLAVLTAQTARADSTFSGGDGSQGNPYKIANETDLRQLATDVNGGNSYSGKFFQQSQDITLTQNFTSIGCYKSNNQGGSKSFSGTYDGGNKTISGLTINGSTNMQGLFGLVENATIQNLTLSGASVTNSASYVGAFVGWSNGVTMTNCHAVNCNVSAPNKNSVAIFVGSLYSPASTIKSCTVSGGSVSGGSDVGAIVGYAYAMSTIHAIVGCVARGVTGGDNLIGTNTNSCVRNVASYGNNDYTITAGTGVTITYSAISNTYSDIIHPPYIKAGETVPVTLSYTGSLSNVTYQATGATLNDEGTQLSNAQGNVTITATEATKTDISGGSIADIAWQTWTGSALTPALTVTVGGKTLTAATDYLVNYTDNTHIGTATATVTGTGAYKGTLTKTFEIRHSDIPYNSTGNFYEIGNETALRALSSYVGSGGETSGRTFKQTEDITLTSSFSPIGIGSYYAFHGIYDGNNKTISGLSVSGNVEYAALFGYVVGGTVKNVILISPSVSSSYKYDSYGARVSALVGYMNFDASGAIIDNCIVINPTLSATGQGNNYVGIFIGVWGSHCSISNCYYYDGKTEHNYAAYQNNNHVPNYSSATNILRVYAVNASGCTATATPTISVGGTDYYKEGTAVTVTASVPSSGIKKFTVTGATASLTETLGQYTLTMPANDVTVSLSDVTPEIAAIDAQTYTGNAIEPAVTVSNMTADTDYTVSYSDNINAGTATATIIGKGFYFGTVIKPFTIAKATPTITAPVAVTNLIYNGSAQALVSAGTTDFGTMTYSLDGTNYSTYIPTATKGGTYTVYYKVEGSDNWNAVDAQTVEVTITPRTYTVTFDANGGEGTMEPMRLTYDGEWTALTANTFIRSGYGFKEWNTEPDGSGTAYRDEEEVYNLTDEVNGNVMLYAQWGWDIATCDIKGTLEAYNDGYGPYYPLSNNVEVWNGNTKLTLNTDYTIELDPNIGTYDYVVGEQYQATIKGTGDWGGKKTFTFTFVELHHTVVFDANGGTGTMASDVATKGQHYTLPPCGFTAPLGKVFDHWVVDYTGIEEDPIKQPGDYFTAPYIWSEYDVQTITVTAYWRDALILLDDDSAQPAGSKNTDIIDANDGTTGLTVQLQGRTLYKDGDWNTICLPFNVTLAGSPLAGAEAKTLETASLENGTLTLNFGANVDELEAGTPYIIKWDGDGTNNIVSPVFSNVTIDKTIHNKVCDLGDGNSITFCGTYSYRQFTDVDKSILFFGTNNTLFYPPVGGYIAAQRAYFALEGITAGDPSDPSNPIKGFVLNFDDETTAVTTPIDPVSEADGTWYDLNGRKLNGKPVQRGIYIHNGRKVAIK